MDRLEHVHDRCKADEFSTGGQLFFTPFIASLRLLIHFGETMPASVPNPYHIPVDLMLLYALVVYGLMVITAGVAAPTGTSP